VNKKIFTLSFMTVLLSSACSTMTPARYSISVDNNLELKKYGGSKIQLMALDSSGSFNANCRLMGPIQASDGMTIPEFVRKAFNDEFKFAEVYGDTGVKLSGNLTRIAFSSSAALTNGWWEFALELESSNGKSMTVETHYDFKSGFDAITACNQTAQALGPAVQDLIKKAVTQPEFAALVK
jgi:hypothetical protein